MFRFRELNQKRIAATIEPITKLLAEPCTKEMADELMKNVKTPLLKKAQKIWPEVKNVSGRFVIDTAKFLGRPTQYNESIMIQVLRNAKMPMIGDKVTFFQNFKCHEIEMSAVQTLYTVHHAIQREVGVPPRNNRRQRHCKEDMLWLQ